MIPELNRKRLAAYEKDSLLTFAKPYKRGFLVRNAVRDVKALPEKTIKEIVDHLLDTHKDVKDLRKGLVPYYELTLVAYLSGGAEGLLQDYADHWIRELKRIARLGTRQAEEDCILIARTLKCMELMRLASPKWSEIRYIFPHDHLITFKKDRDVIEPSLEQALSYYLRLANYPDINNRPFPQIGIFDFIRDTRGAVGKVLR